MCQKIHRCINIYVRVCEQHVQNQTADRRRFEIHHDERRQVVKAGVVVKAIVFVGFGLGGRGSQAGRDDVGDNLLFQRARLAPAPAAAVGHEGGTVGLLRVNRTLPAAGTAARTVADATIVLQRSKRARGTRRYGGRTVIVMYRGRRQYFRKQQPDCWHTFRCFFLPFVVVVSIAVRFRCEAHAALPLVIGGGLLLPFVLRAKVLLHIPHCVLDIALQEQ